MNNLQDIFFYQLEKSIKSYRQFAQANITRAGYDITIDQWLVMKVVSEQKNCRLTEVAEIVFKDNASLTRIVALLVNKKLMLRLFDKRDRRAVLLQLTPAGKKLLTSVEKTILENRHHALAGISRNNLLLTQKTLLSISANCLK